MCLQGIAYYNGSLWTASSAAVTRYDNVDALALAGQVRTITSMHSALDIALGSHAPPPPLLHNVLHLSSPTLLHVSHLAMPSNHSKPSQHLQLATVARASALSSSCCSGKDEAAALPLCSMLLLAQPLTAVAAHVMCAPVVISPALLQSFTDGTVVFGNLPPMADHGAHYIAIGPDQKVIAVHSCLLLISLGACTGLAFGHLCFFVAKARLST